jgi:hypothetical protein
MQAERNVWVWESVATLIIIMESYSYLKKIIWDFHPPSFKTTVGGQVPGLGEHTMTTEIVQPGLPGDCSGCDTGTIPFAMNDSCYWQLELCKNPSAGGVNSFHTCLMNSKYLV